MDMFTAGNRIRNTVVVGRVERLPAEDAGRQRVCPALLQKKARCNRSDPRTFGMMNVIYAVRKVFVKVNGRLHHGFPRSQSQAEHACESEPYRQPHMYSLSRNAALATVFRRHGYDTLRACRDVSSGHPSEAPLLHLSCSTHMLDGFVLSGF